MNRALKIDGVSDRIANLPRDWSLGTTCTGSGTFEIALRAVSDAMSGCLPVDAEPFVVPCHLMLS